MQAWGKIRHSFADGERVIDVDRLWKLLYDRKRTQNYTSEKFYDAVKVDTGMFGPDVVNIEIKWEQAAADARGWADENVATICYKLTAGEFSAASFAQKVKNEIGALEAAQNRWADNLQKNGKRNAEALSRNVDNWETAIAVARGTRNAATTVLVVGATVLTAGGAAGAGIAATGVGSALTGIGKVQDSERHLTTEQAIGAAVVTTSADFCTTVLTGGIAKGAKLAWAGKAVVAFLVKVPMKTATSITMAEMTRRKDEPATELGPHAWKAVQEWAVDQATGLVAAKLLKIPRVNTLVRKLAVVSANAIKDNPADLKGALASQLVRTQTSKAAAKGLEKATTAAFELTAGAIAGSAPDRSPLPEAVVRQPIHGGAAVGEALLKAIILPAQ